MKIFAVNMTCARDQELEDLMARTLQKHCPECEVLLSLNTDDTPYGNGAGWGASMMKLEAIRQLLRENDVKDTDYILSVDSDVVFTSPEVFKFTKHGYGIIGIKHRPEFNTKVGKWSHMSGALIFLRGGIAKLMAGLTEETLNNIRFNHFKPYNLTENEDVVLSYLADYACATYFDLGSVPGLTSGDFESDIRERFGVNYVADLLNGANAKRSFYHLNYCPTQFLGEPVAGKWMIPSILKQKGIEL